jgi:CubicO group peptidase (beta-lactamase class C family)
LGNVKDREDPVSKIDSLITAAHLHGEFNGNILVARGSEVIFTKALGYANGSKQELSITNKFLIGSIYKEIPALGIMQLEELKLLNLEDRISKYLPSLPGWAAEISIKNLLQYTSGLPKVSWSKHAVVNNENLITDLFEMDSLQFKPGSDYLYTNYSPFLLAQIIEKVSGEPYEVYVQKQILFPQEMSNSKFLKQFPSKDDFLAQPLDADYKESFPPFKIESSRFLFATTVEDLFSMVHHLHRYQIIQKQSLKQLASAPTYVGENVQTPLGKAQFSEDRLVEHVHHGSSGAYESLLFMRNELTIILMTNQKRSNLFQLSEKIEKLF